MDDVMADRCPWCEKRTVGFETKFMRALIAPLADDTQWVPCGFCGGTGLASEWRQHPEYARQFADERLTKYKIDWPAGTHAH